MFFLCEITGSEPRPSLETSEIAFFAEDELPDLSPGRVQPAQIRRMFEHWRCPGLPTDFDQGPSNLIPAPSRNSCASPGKSVADAGFSSLSTAARLG
jgi:hypothetical protein